MIHHDGIALTPACSPHRTLDPNEADFFYVPVYSACIFDLWQKTSKPRWPDVPGTLNAIQAL
jgi:hypothetical protein